MGIWSALEGGGGGGVQMGTYNIYIYGVGVGKEGLGCKWEPTTYTCLLGEGGGCGEGASGANGNLQHIHVYEELEKIIWS